MSTACPRPRPRPRPRNAATSAESIKPGSSSTSLVEDEDAMFIRNKNRSTKGWNTMTQAVNKTEQLKRSPSKDRSSDLDLSDSPSPRSKRAKKSSAKVKELPKWTKTGGLINISESEASDDDIILDSTPRGKPVVRTPKGKRKRNRSRSPLLTPPPPPSAADVQNARNVAHDVLRISPRRRASSPAIELEDDLGEIVDLDPELARIEAQVKKRAWGAPTPANVGAAGSVLVDLRIRLLPHPEDESGKVHIYSHQMKRNELFSQLFDEIADEVGIIPGKLVVTYNNKKVFAASTPATLSIWSEAELEACEEHIYEYIKVQQYTHRFQSVEDHVDAPAATDPAVLESGAESDASHDKGNTFKLQLRSGAQTVTVTVRPTTKCSSIVATFVRKTEKPAAAAKKARIEVDGAKMSPESEIGDADLEDGDLVDIVGV